jgi:prevent-host-death family protein
VNAAQQSGPQIVTRRGADAAVVLSFEDYRKLERRRPNRSIIELLRSAPKVSGGLVGERAPELSRPVELE